MRIDFELDDLTNSALKRIVRQLLVASDKEEKAILDRLKKPAKNDLADLDEDMHGRPNTPKVEDDDSGFDLSVDAEGDESEGSEPPMQAKKKGKK